MLTGYIYVTRKFSSDKELKRQVFAKVLSSKPCSLGGCRFRSKVSHECNPPLSCDGNMYRVRALTAINPHTPSRRLNKVWILAGWGIEATPEEEVAVLVL